MPPAIKCHHSCCYNDSHLCYICAYLSLIECGVFLTSWQTIIMKQILARKSYALQVFSPSQWYCSASTVFSSISGEFLYRFEHICNTHLPAVFDILRDQLRSVFLMIPRFTQGSYSLVTLDQETLIIMVLSEGFPWPDYWISPPGKPSISIQWLSLMFFQAELLDSYAEDAEGKTNKSLTEAHSNRDVIGFQDATFTGRTIA